MVSERFKPFGTNIFTEITTRAQEKHAINLSQGFPDFDCPLDFSGAAARAVSEGNNQYARSMGCPVLVEEIARAVRVKSGLRYDAYTEVAVFNGASEGIAGFFLGFLNPGDEVILFEPHYDSYPACAAMAGAVPRYYTMRYPHFTIEENELRKCFNRKTRLLLLNTPHNPTGKVFSREELELIARLCIEHDVVVITDEVYENLTYGPAVHISMASIPGMRDRTVTVSSAGKTFSITGWKIGWATGPAPLIEALQSAHQYLSFATATPLQHAFASVLKTAGEDYYNQLNSEYSERRALLLGSLEKTGFGVVPPDGAYYILADFSDLWEGDDRSFVYHLIDRCGVAAIPPSAFYTEGVEEGKRLVRFAFCKKLDTLREAVLRIEKGLGV